MTEYAYMNKQQAREHLVELVTNEDFLSLEPGSRVWLKAKIGKKEGAWAASLIAV